MANKEQVTWDKNAQVTTRICLEQAQAENPYLAAQRFVHGYAVDELWSGSSFIDVLLLNFLGELPSNAQKRQLETLFIGLMNLGPRDAGIRAAMLAGITKTSPEHLLPIGLLASQGHQNGANETEAAHEFIARHRHQDPFRCGQKRCAQLQDKHDHIAPGFGSSYGDIDPIIQRLADHLLAIAPEAQALVWCSDFVKALKPKRQGWLVPGLVACVCLDLGIAARESVGIYQLAKSVGIVACGMEQTHFPINATQMLADKHYELCK